MHMQGGGSRGGEAAVQHDDRGRKRKRGEDEAEEKEKVEKRTLAAPH
jgi:hypothetical protein